MNPANGRMMKRFNANATAPDDIPHFLDFAHEQAVFSKHAVFVDKVSGADPVKYGEENAPMARDSHTHTISFFLRDDYRLYIRVSARMSL